MLDIRKSSCGNSIKFYVLRLKLMAFLASTTLTRSKSLIRWVIFIFILHQDSDEQNIDHWSAKGSFTYTFEVILLKD